MSRSEESVANPEPARFSRYRSVRLKNVAATTNHGAGSTGSDSHARAVRDNARTLSNEIPPEPALDPSSTNSIARSKSRYRRRAASVSSVVDNDAARSLNGPQARDTHPIPPVPSLPSMAKATSTGQGAMCRPSSPDGRIGNGAEAAAHVHRDPTSPPAPHQLHDIRAAEHAPKRLHRRVTEDHIHTIGRTDASFNSSMADQGDRMRRVRGGEEGLGVPSRTEAERLLAQQKKKDLERLEIELANAQPPPDLRSPKTRSPIVEKFTLFSRRKKSKDGTSPTSSSAGSAANSMDGNRAHMDPPEVPKIPKGIGAGGTGIVPQKDAPVSAVNHGGRIVSVRCKKHTFILPVTPDTTPVDILLATAKNVNFDLEWSPSEGIVMEAYGPLGLERRLRRYEHIRDVMNSWDRDTHNHLVVAASDNPKRDRDLDISFVANTGEPPKGAQQYMYHSSRPGKWNKRWITLTDQGQLVLAKKPDASASDKDAVSLCHLSDYDLYMPTESQMRRHLKPPKKYCFAVKSQHKPAMFLDTENYVQYFSTDDPKLAAQFYDKVQGWRSWYLVDRSTTARRGSVSKADDRPPQLSPIKQEPRKTVNVASEGGHRLRVSVDETPYTLGEFEPLFDMKRFDKRISLFGQDFLTDEPEHVSAPKIQPRNQVKVDSRKVSNSSAEGKVESKSEAALITRIKSANDEAFTGNGLLGNVYEDRKANMERNAARKGSGNNYDGTAAVLSRQTSPPDQSGSNWFPSATQHSSRNREPGERPTTSGGVARRSSHSRSRSQSRPPPMQSQSRTRHDTHPNPLGSHHLNSATSSPTLSQSSGGRFQPLNPLVDLTPTFKEAPQWVKKGHGVQAEGVRHLVDFISPGNTKDGPSGLLDIPPRGPIRRELPTSRPPLSTPDAVHRVGVSGPLSRSRSKSSSAPPSKTLLGEIPPMPSLPGRQDGRTMTISSRDHRDHRDNRDHRSRERGREKERTLPEYNSVPGRTGTLKVV